MTSRSRSWSFVIGSAAASLAVVLAGSHVIGSTKRFQERQRQLAAQFRAAQQAEGLAGSANSKALLEKYPTPEIGLAKVQAVEPGQSTKVSLPGRFAPGTIFLAEHDAVEVTDESVGATALTATLTVAPAAYPSFVRLWAFAPVSGARNAAIVAFIGAARGYEFATRDGWTVKMTPLAQAFVVSSSAALLPYAVEFFRRGDTTPVESMSTLLKFERHHGPGETLALDLDRGRAAVLAAEYEEMGAARDDVEAFRKKTRAEQQAFGKKMDQVYKDWNAARQPDESPEARQRWEDEFGCFRLSLSFGDRMSASVTCGRAIGSLQLEPKVVQ